MVDKRTVHDDGEIEVRADFNQSSCPLSFRLLGEEAWQATPYQVADAAHDPERALKLIQGWTGQGEPGA